jgi:hypothetical protein
MIIQDYFLKKISELAHMRCLSITPATAKNISIKFEEFEPADLDRAVEVIMMETERFDFVRLLRRLAHSRADRLESESTENRINEGRAAKRFFDPARYIGECTREACKGCPHIKNCELRGKEWIKGINAIMHGKLGSEGAEQLIHYMKHEFMGGIE